MVSLRHGPLTFWVALTAALAGAAALALLLGAGTPAPDAAGPVPTQQRHELLEFRNQLAYLATLARHPDQELADEAAELAGIALQSAERSSDPLAAGYRDLAQQLGVLEQFVLEQFVTPPPAVFQYSGPAPGDTGHVRLSQLPAAPLVLPDAGDAGHTGQRPGDLMPVDDLSAARAQVARKVSRILAAADRLVPLTWR
jgi:hypothetical protein